MTKFQLLLLPVFAIWLNACFSLKCLDGEGEIITQSYTGFTETGFDIGFHADVVFIKSNETKVEISTYENLFERIVVEEKSGDISIESSKCFNTKKDPQITIYYQDVNEITVNGSADVSFNETLNTSKLEVTINGSGDANIPVQAKKVTVKINGSGDVILKGKTDDSTIKINGSGDIAAKDFNSKNASVKVTGSGGVTLSVSKKLESTITGSGDVMYYGNPSSVNNKTVGSGTTKKMGN